jgi:hypothetical protein
MKDTLPDFDFSSAYATTLRQLLNGEEFDLEHAHLALLAVGLQVRERIEEHERETRTGATLMRDPTQWQRVSDDDLA